MKINFPYLMMELIYTHKAALWWLASSSLFFFLVTLIVIPLVIIRIPADYFTRKKRRKKCSDSHPLLKGVFVLCKNAMGSILVITGLIMLLTPGQGLFTIFVGLMLMNFPGKYRIEKWLFTRSSIRRSANWLRLRAGCKPFNFE